MLQANTQPNETSTTVTLDTPVTIDHDTLNIDKVATLQTKLDKAFKGMQMNGAKYRSVCIEALNSYTLSNLMEMIRKLRIVLCQPCVQPLSVYVMKTIAK